MNPAIAKVLMKAMRDNSMSVIKYYASKMGMSRGKLLSTAKKVDRATPKDKKMTAREKILRQQKEKETSTNLRMPGGSVRPYLKIPLQKWPP